MNALCFDGRKDATQTIAQDPNNKHYRSMHLEEHYTVVGDPGTYYLPHFFFQKKAKADLLQKKLFDSFKDTELEHKLAMVGTDGTASMTGKYNGCIRGVVELLNKPLPWIVCLLYTNEFPL